MQEKILNIIYKTLSEVNEELDHESLKNPSLDTKLFGGAGALDSLALVLFITDLEEKISDEFDKDVVLADEKAMSARVSPFRNVKSLNEHIQSLLES